MRDDQEHEKQTLAMLSGLRATWKKALLGLPLFIAFTLFYFYGMNMVTTPWAYTSRPLRRRGTGSEFCR